MKAIDKLIKDNELQDLNDCLPADISGVLSKMCPKVAEAAKAYQKTRDELDSALSKALGGGYVGEDLAYAAAQHLDNKRQRDPDEWAAMCILIAGRRQAEASTEYFNKILEKHTPP